MRDTQLRSGMDWVARTLRELGHDQGVDIHPISWDTDDADLNASRHHFVLSLNGQRRVVPLEDADLLDVAADPRLQILIENDLRAFLNDDCAEVYRPAESVFAW